MIHVVRTFASITPIGVESVLAEVRKHSGVRQSCAIAGVSDDTPLRAERPISLTKSPAFRQSAADSSPGGAEPVSATSP